jgi:hypothetical protein
MCDSKELLISYLYDELDSADKQRFRAHLAECPECREEVAGLHSTQRHLAAWTPPEPDLGFHIVRSSAPPVAAPRVRMSPLWGLAAAAVLVLAAGAAIANVEVQYGPQGFVARTGWNTAGDSAGAAATATGPMTVDFKQQAEALERRVRELEAAAQAVPASAGTDAGDAEVLRRVSQMMDERQTRQERAMAVRIAELTRDIDARRKVDLALIDQGLMRLQTTSGAELRQSRDLLQRTQQMYRATAYQPK